MTKVISRRPFVIPVYYTWLNAAGLKPHIIAKVDYPGMCIPDGYAVDGRIVLSIHHAAIRNLDISDNWITFEAVFDIHPVVVRIPMGAIIMMFAPETLWHDDFSDDNVPEVDLPEKSKMKNKTKLRILPKLTD